MGQSGLNLRDNLRLDQGLVLFYPLHFIRNELILLMLRQMLVGRSHAGDAGLICGLRFGILQKRGVVLHRRILKLVKRCPRNLLLRALILVTVLLWLFDCVSFFELCLLLRTLSRETYL